MVKIKESSDREELRSVYVDGIFQKDFADKILIFSAHRSQIKNTGAEFGGKTKVAFILSWQRGDIAGSSSRTVPHLP